MKQLHLAYSHQNKALADTIEAIINDVVCIHHTDHSGQPDGTFANELQESEGPIVLLITDNFIKSEQCMSGALPMLLTLMRQNRVLPVVADGVVEKEGTTLPVETHIDRVVNAIQYMNFWQQEYLGLSDLYNHGTEEDRAAQHARLQIVHGIADQTGEFISALRDADCVKWSYLEEANFVDIYTRLGIPHTKEAEAPIALPQEETPVATPISAPNQTAPTHSIHTTPMSGLWFTPAPPPEAAHALEEEEFDAIEHLIHPNDANESNTVVHSGRYKEQEIENTVRDAWAWIEKGNAELGLEIFQLAMQQYPDHAGLKAEYEKAVAHNADTPTPESPQNEAHSYEVTGDSAFHEGDYLMAKYCWDRATETDPDLPGIWRKLGLLTSDQLTGYTETSIIYLKKALNEDPTDTTIIERLRALGENIPAPVIETVAETTTETVLEAAPEETPTEEPHTPEENTAPIPVTPEEPVISLAPAPVMPPMVAHKRETVLVTGATSGIGKATAIEFARHGYRLILTGRRSERLFDLKDQLQQQFGTEVLTLTFDVRDVQAVENALLHLPEAWADVDILINNAGLAKGLAPIHEGQLVHWETMIDTNLKGLLYVTRIISRRMVQRRKGHIVNVSSSAGKEAYPNGNVYCATKFGVEALTKSMRFDLYQYGIRVSQVSPGHVEETEFAINRFDGDAQKARIYDDFEPLKASDVAETIWFIASRPAHVNVQDVVIFSTQQASATVVDRSGRQ